MAPPRPLLLPPHNAQLCWTPAAFMSPALMRMFHHRALALGAASSGRAHTIWFRRRMQDWAPPSTHWEPRVLSRVECKGWVSSVMFIFVLFFFPHKTFPKYVFWGIPVCKAKKKREDPFWLEQGLCAFGRMGRYFRAPEMNSEIFHLERLLVDLHSMVPRKLCKNLTSDLSLLSSPAFLPITPVLLEYLSACSVSHLPRVLMSREEAKTVWMTRQHFHLMFLQIQLTELTLQYSPL